MDQLTAFCQTEYAHLMAMHGLSKIWSTTKLGTIKEAGGQFYTELRLCRQNYPSCQCDAVFMPDRTLTFTLTWKWIGLSKKSIKMYDTL
jgi:hypothetical protein